MDKEAGVTVRITKFPQRCCCCSGNLKWIARGASCMLATRKIIASSVFCSPDACIMNAVFSTNPKQGPKPPAMKQINSIAARPHTLPFFFQKPLPAADLVGLGVSDSLRILTLFKLLLRTVGPLKRQDI